MWNLNILNNESYETILSKRSFYFQLTAINFGTWNEMSMAWQILLINANSEVVKNSNSNKPIGFILNEISQNKY